jgi:CubicO group peptidase (beta-lactamase class C family)
MLKASSALLVVVLLTLQPAIRGSADDGAAEPHAYVRAMRDAGREPVAFVLDRLKDHDLLIFDDGLHTAVEPFAFYQQLVRDPHFHRLVKYIFLEVLPINLQPHVDAYLDAERDDPTLLHPVFQDDYGGSGFPYKTYFELLHTVCEVNQKLPPTERLKVIAVSTPVHWQQIKTPADLALFRKGLGGRDALMYGVILGELDGFQSGRKGIFLTNTRHAYKGIRDRQNRLFWNCGTYFHDRHPGRTYSVRCHNVQLYIEQARSKDTAKPATAEGMERFVYHWTRPGRGRWDEAWRQLGNRPTALPLAGNVFGREAYVGNHMLDAAPGQTMADAYDAVIFLAPLEQLRQTALVAEIYTPAFKEELARRYRVLYTPEQLAARFREAGVRNLAELIDKEHAGAPERPLPQLEGLEPVESGALSPRQPHPLTPDSIVLTLPLAPEEAPLRVTLAQMMDIYKVPGFSVAVIDHDRVAWARGFGVTAAGGSTPVTDRTLFQAASVSKPVTAAGALWLVEHGKLSLDEDVNLKLKTWKVPDNQFTPTQKVTLRRILCHNAGFNVAGFDGYAQGKPLPIAPQTLDGLAPANNPPVRVVSVPGSKCEYSGGGYVVAGVLMSDAAGQSFEEFMRQRVLLPAGMRDSTFLQDLPPELAARAAAGTRRNGEPLAGKWHRFPELAPDGLWSTPGELAKFAIEIALSKRGNANHVLSRRAVEEMLTVQCHDDPHGPGGTGLGFALGFQHHPEIFFHNGSNVGFQSALMADPVAGWGYAAMGNSDNFQPVNRAVLQTLAKANGWDIVSNTRDIGVDLAVVRALRGVQAALDSYRRAKSGGFAGLRHDANTLNNFGYSLLGEKKFADAIRVFQLNVAEYPKDANTYDSLAEAYTDAGERDLAIQNYEKSLQLDPKNDNAATRLKRLRSK